MGSKLELPFRNAREACERDGAVHVPGLLSPEQLGAAGRAWEWSLANPTRPDACARLWGTERVRFIYEQVMTRAPGFLQLHPKTLPETSTLARAS
jgi:hypothetical protein